MLNAVTSLAAAAGSWFFTTILVASAYRYRRRAAFRKDVAAGRFNFDNAWYGMPLAEREKIAKAALLIAIGRQQFDLRVGVPNEAFWCEVIGIVAGNNLPGLRRIRAMRPNEWR